MVAPLPTVVRSEVIDNPNNLAADIVERLRDAVVDNAGTDFDADYVSLSLLLRESVGVSVEDVLEIDAERQTDEKATRRLHQLTLDVSAFEFLALVCGKVSSEASIHRISGRISMMSFYRSRSYANMGCGERESARTRFRRHSGMRAGRAGISTPDPVHGER